MKAGGGTHTDFIYTNNITPVGAYGFHGGTDGKDIGADIDAIEAVWAVPPPRTPPPT